jgi:hypothetical protein
MCAQDLFMAARTSIKPGCFLRSALLLAGVVAFGGIALPVYGSEEDPFQVDTGHWMSFERYKDNVKAGRPVPTAPENTPADATPLETLVPVAAPEPVVTAPETQPVVAAPSRPLDLPVLPGVNQGFSVRVDSTADESQNTSKAQIVNFDSKPTLHLEEQNWQDAAEAARQSAAAEARANGDDQHVPLNIRMSFLPNAKITPVPSPEYKSTHGRGPLPTAPQMAKAPPAQKPEDLAACAAVDAYKKKQLEAIQSDRQTLDALQSAISQLGLQKQLSFLAGAQGSVTADTGAKMDMPQNVPATVAHP